MVTKEGNLWRVKLQRNGAKYSTTFPTRKQAEEYQAQIISAHNAGRTGKIARYTLIAAFDRWVEEELPRQKARKTTANHSAQLLPYLEGKYLDETTAVWAEFKKDHPKLKPSTLNRKGAILRRIVNLAYKEWRWLANPIFVALLPENNQRKVYVTKEQMYKIADASNCPETNALIRILFFTGLRVSEALVATPTKEGLFVPDTKNGKAALIPIHREIESLMGVYPFKRKYRYYYGRFVKAKNAAGFPEVNIHDLRHSTASALVHSGASLVEIRDTLRHANIHTTNRYLHLYSGAVKAAIDKI